MTPSVSIEKSLLSDVIARRDFNALVRSGLNDESDWHEQRDAFNFVKAHVAQYGEMPSLESVIRACPTFEAWDVVESTETLVAKLHERNVKLAERRILEEAAKMFADHDAYALMRFLETELDQVRQAVNARTGVGSVNLTKNVDARQQAYEERASGEGRGCVPLFWSQIHEAAGLARYGDYWNIEAATKVGKTWLGWVAGVTANNAGYRVYHALAESNKEEAGARFDTVLFGISNRGIFNGSLDEITKETYFRKLDELKRSGRPDYIVKTPEDWASGLTVEQIEADIDQYAPDVVIIDQFNLMEHRGNEHGDKARTSRRLKLLFARKRVVGVVLTQANGDYVKRQDRQSDDHDENEIRELRPPKRGDYSDTIAVRQDCTQMIALDADNRFHKAVVVVEISRTGGEGTTVDLSWFPDAGIIRPRQPQDDF